MGDSINFTYPDLKITISKEGGVTYNNVNQKIVDLSKTDPSYDIKFMIGLNKFAEQQSTLEEAQEIEDDSEDFNTPSTGRTDETFRLKLVQEAEEFQQEDWTSLEKII